MIKTYSIKNGQHAIQLRSSSYSTVNGNTLNDNSQKSLRSYSGVYINDAGNGIYSLYNLIENNIIIGSVKNTYKYGVGESSSNENHNQVAGNTIGGAYIPIQLKGPQSTASNNTILP